MQRVHLNKAAARLEPSTLLKVNRTCLLSQKSALECFQWFSRVPVCGADEWQCLCLMTGGSSGGSSRWRWLKVRVGGIVYQWCWYNPTLARVYDPIFTYFLSFFLFFYHVITSLISFNSFYPTIKFLFIFFFTVLIYYWFYLFFVTQCFYKLGPLGFKISSWFVCCPDSDSAVF